MKGLVLKSTGSWYQVKTDTGQIIACRIKGKLRLDQVKHTNPVTVGDHIEFETEPDQETGIITKVLPRTNYIIRKASNLSKQTHILASNIDLAVLVATVAFPTTSTGFIDRFLATAEAYHIRALIVFNKSDLLNSEAQAVADEMMDLYTSIGYECLSCSATTLTGIEALKEKIKGKISLFSGHSGVGKSTLLNAIDPTLQVKTGSISAYHLKGQHTTTFAEMHELQTGGYIIDTPGIREFGVVELEGAEISHYFVEMRPLLTRCRFNNCSHTNEPGCAVKQAVNENKIALSRYQNYLSILENIDSHR